MPVSTTHSTTLFEDINEVLVHREQKVQSVIFQKKYIPNASYKIYCEPSSTEV